MIIKELQNKKSNILQQYHRIMITNYISTKRCNYCKLANRVINVQLLEN